MGVLIVLLAVVIAWFIASEMDHYFTVRRDREIRRMFDR